MMSQEGDVCVHTSALVAELCLAAVAGHVIAALRPLDVDAAEGALLTVGIARCLGSGPLLEVLLALAILRTRHVLVPGGLAAKAPDKTALFAGYPDILRLEALEAARELVLGHQVAVGTGLAATVLALSQSKPVISLLCGAGSIGHDFGPRDDPILAVWVWAENVYVPFILDVGSDDFLDAGFANDLGAAPPRGDFSRSDAVITDRAFLSAGIVFAL